MSNSGRISRRAFLGGGAALASGAGGLFWAERTADRGRLNARHRPGPPSAEVPSDGVLSILTAYLGAYFGRVLSAADQAELYERMTFAATRDGAWNQDYEAAAALLDEGALAAGAAGYVNASSDIQLRVLQELRTPPADALAILRLGFSDRAAARERLRVSTTRHLVRLYRRSGVPWRHRGYQTWPGVPDRSTAHDRLNKA